MTTDTTLHDRLLHTASALQVTHDQVFSAYPELSVLGAIDDLREAAAALAVRGGAEYEFEVWQDDEMQASGSAPDFDQVISDAAHYARMYGQDGPVTINYYERREIAAPQPPEEAP